MEFNKSLDWLKESDDDELLGNDELDLAKPDEEMNEGLYVDPSNYDKHNDLVDVVDKQGNPQKMTQATYDKNKDLGEFKKTEPKEEPNNYYNDDDYYSDDDDYNDYYSNDYYSDDDDYNDYYSNDYYSNDYYSDDLINNVNYANHPDYDNAYKQFINNYLDSSNKAYKTIYRTANGEYDPDELNQSELAEISKVVDDLSNSDITNSIFYNRLKRAADYHNNHYDDDYYSDDDYYNDYDDYYNDYDDYYNDYDDYYNDDYYN